MAGETTPAPGPRSTGSLGAGSDRREVPPETMAHLRRVVDRTRPPDLAGEHLLPLTGATEHLLPGVGLARGSVVTVGGGAGATTLALALVAGACRTGSWVVCVGFPHLGWEAVEEVGLPLDRVVAVRAPSRGWTKVVGALLDAFEVVLCGPEVVPTPAELRIMRARARERRAVLVGVEGVLTTPGGVGAGRPGRRWPPADVRLRVERSRWQGLGEGWGRLGRRRLDVVVEGRGSLARPMRSEVVLDASGRPEAPTGADRPALHGGLSFVPPGSGVPGSSVPGSGVPGSGVPGSSVTDRAG